MFPLVSLSPNDFSDIRLMLFYVSPFVSLAYVRGEQEGVIKERPWTKGETVNGNFDLDIDYEFQIARKNLEMVKKEKRCESTITKAMKDVGNKRFETKT